MAVTLMDTSDQITLVALAGRGDPFAQEHFVALLSRRVRKIAVAILAHPQDAEDATQNILIELLRSAPGFRGGSLQAWADKIAVRTAIREAKKRNVRSTRLTAEYDVEALGVERMSQRTHDLPRPVLEYLAELPEARRTVLVLKHVLDYSIQEIAELTECSPNTVKDRLVQARKQLRRTIRRETALGMSGLNEGGT